MGFLRKFFVFVLIKCLRKLKTKVKNFLFVEMMKTKMKIQFITLIWTLTWVELISASDTLLSILLMPQINENPNMHVIQLSVCGNCDVASDTNLCDTFIKVKFTKTPDTLFSIPQWSRYLSTLQEHTCQNVTQGQFNMSLCRKEVSSNGCWVPKVTQFRRYSFI